MSVGVIRVPLSTTLTSYAVLDAQWCPHDYPDRRESPLLAVASSKGAIHLYHLHVYRNHHSDGGTRAELKLFTEISVAEPSVLVLSIAWHPRYVDALGYTLSDGGACVAMTSAGVVGASEEAFRIQILHVHDLEAWTMTFRTANSADGTVCIISGGDDLFLRCTTDKVFTSKDSKADVTSDTAQFREYDTSPWQTRRFHTAGVTALLLLTEDLLVTGSYDDHIRLLAIPGPSNHFHTPRVLSEADLGGGVWRLRLLRRKPRSGAAHVLSKGDRLGEQYARCGVSYLILASCMHAGARVVDLIQSPVNSVEDRLIGAESEHDGLIHGSWAFQIRYRFEEHASMNYASDVAPASLDLNSEPMPDGANEVGREPAENDTGYSGPLRIISTSFYDRKVCMWEMPA